MVARMDSHVLGARVRQLRRESGYSLARLGADSGVSSSMISQIECGGRMPTVLVLDKLATALGTSIARLLSEDSEPGVTVLRSAEQPVLVDPAGWQRRILSPVLEGVEFEFMRTVLEQGVDAGLFDPHAKGSREYVAVEKGRLRLTLDDDMYVLGPGDSIFFPGACHHGFANGGRGRCVYYLVMDLGSHAAGHG
jgi:transcriptional regulator with XRE-family HTH domain